MIQIQSPTWPHPKAKGKLTRIIKEKQPTREGDYGQSPVLVLSPRASGAQQTAHGVLKLYIEKSRSPSYVLPPKMALGPMY